MNKGVCLKFVGGYLHRRKKTYNDTEYWVCVEQYCLGEMTTINGQVVSGPEDYFHEPSLGKYVSRKQRNFAKVDAGQNPSKRCREIYDSVNSEITNQLQLDPDLIGTNLRPFSGLKATIN